MWHEWGRKELYRLFVGKVEGKRLQGRKRRRWVDNIKMDLEEIEWGGVEWIDLLGIGKSGELL
jgi:hypothetical protein